MKGEALLDSLPQNWTIVEKWYPQSRGYYDAFLDRSTGSTQIEDPRLGPLPAGWRTRSHEDEDAYNWYVNYKTGESNFRHPSLKFDALKARGVKFEEFRLI